MSFLGYPRNNGLVGTRNYIGIISTVSCANDVTWEISNQVHGTATFIHSQGCCQTKPDIDIVTRTLTSLGKNPNLAGVLIISLGCESISPDIIIEKIAKTGKPVEKIIIQKIGGYSAAVKRGVFIARDMVKNASETKREKFPDSGLIIGIKCGASDTTSGIISNPAIGSVCDLIIDKNGTCIFGETTEFIGAEHILAGRAADQKTGKKILQIVSQFEERANEMGFDMRGGQPTKGNIKGGLTTIEEKSLGAIIKAGTKPIQGVFEYGERISGKGLFIVNTPGREPEFLTALAAAGAQVIIFSTGIGAPQGFPFIPVIKITGNPNTFENLKEHMDILVKLSDSHNNITKMGRKIYEEVLEVSSGKKTKAEKIGYGNFPNIFTIGPVL